MLKSIFSECFLVMLLLVMNISVINFKKLTLIKRHDKKKVLIT